MKILDKIGSWIDKLDAKIFGKENYQPLAGQGFVAALKTAVGVGIWKTGRRVLALLVF